MKKLLGILVLGLLWCNFSLASAELIFEYNQKLLNKKLSIKEIVKICKEYESKNINAAEYSQAALNTDIGIHNYCTTAKQKNEHTRIVSMTSAWRVGGRFGPQPS